MYSVLHECWYVGHQSSSYTQCKQSIMPIFLQYQPANEMGRGGKKCTNLNTFNWAMQIILRDNLHTSCLQITHTKTSIAWIWGMTSTVLSGVPTCSFWRILHIRPHASCQPLSWCEPGTWQRRFRRIRLSGAPAGRSCGTGLSPLPVINPNY